MDMPEEEVHKNRKNREVEVAIGTWHGLGRLVHIRGTGLGRLKLDSPAACFWGQSMAMIRHGGSELVYSGKIVWTEEIAVHRRKSLQKLLDACRKNWKALTRFACALICMVTLRLPA